MNRRGISPRLIAHRCNDLPSIRKALGWYKQKLVAGLECDVRATKDGILVVQHDADCGRQAIARTRFQALPKKLLTLAEWLEATKLEGLKLHLDIKPICRSGRWQAAVESRVLHQQLQEKEVLSRAIVTSQDGEFLEQLRRLAPGLYLGCLHDQSYGVLPPASQRAIGLWLNRIVALHGRIRINGVFLNQEWLKGFESKYGLLAMVVNILKEKGIQVDVWTINDQNSAEYFSRQGMDWITTDQPKKIKKSFD